MFHPRELNWKESFPTIVGAHVFLPPKTVLWRDPAVKERELYQFSARSDKCCASYSSDTQLRLVDFRYICLLSEKNMYTLESVTKGCRYIKEQCTDTSFGITSYSLHGVIFCTTNGIHIVLFDMGSVERSPEEVVFPTLGKDVHWVVPPDITPLRVSQHVEHIYPRRIFIPDATSNSPLPFPIEEGSIEECCVDSTDDPNWPIQLEISGLRHPNHHLSDTSRMTSYYDIAWKKPFLPVYGSHIDLPVNTLLWRGYDSLYPAISGRPAYYGDKETAKEYVKTSASHALGLFAATRPLKLLDVRFLKVLLKDLFENSDGNAVQKTTVAFGLCSLRHQVDLMKVLYADAIREGRDPGYETLRKGLLTHSTHEQPGVRVAETSNDGWVMTFLGEVFEGVVDGFVSPPLFTPYQVHTQYILHSELILFNPLKSGIVQLSAVPRMIQLSISDLIQKQCSSPITLRARALETTYVSCGGGSFLASSILPLESFNNLVNRGDPDTTRIYKEAQKEGKRFRKRVGFIGRIL